jgi:hypothetical protein
MPQRRADTLQVCRASKLNTLAGPLQHSFSFLKQAGHPEGNLGVLRWCALSLPLLSRVPVTVDRQVNHSITQQQLSGRVGRLAEGEDTVIFARVDEAEKCEFIKANAPEDAWASTDDGSYLLIKASALREQAREMLVSTVRSRTSPLSQPVMALRIDCHMHQRASCRLVLSPLPLA